MWKKEIDQFLKRKLSLELHSGKSKVLDLAKGINFLGFRIFPHHKLLRKSNMNFFDRKFNQLKLFFGEEIISRAKVLESFEGWLAYATHADTYKYRRHLVREFNRTFPLNSNKQIGNSKKHKNFIRKLFESETKFSVQKTALLFSKGLSIEEISEAREIKNSTVWEHLSELIEHKQISVWQVLPSTKIKKILFKIYTSRDRLRNIKKRIKDNSINYDEINCVLASVKGKKRFKKQFS